MVLGEETHTRKCDAYGEDIQVVLLEETQVRFPPALTLPVGALWQLPLPTFTSRCLSAFS